MTTLETIKEMEKEFDEKFVVVCPTGKDKGREVLNPIFPEPVMSFFHSYTRTLLESFGEEIIPTEFKLKGRDEEYIRGFNDGHKYAVGEQRLKVKEIISSIGK